MKVSTTSACLGLLLSFLLGWAGCSSGTYVTWGYWGDRPDPRMAAVMLDRVHAYESRPFSGPRTSGSSALLADAEAARADKFGLPRGRVAEELVARGLSPETNEYVPLELHDALGEYMGNWGVRDHEFAADLVQGYDADGNAVSIVSVYGPEMRNDALGYWELVFSGGLGQRIALASESHYLYPGVAGLGWAESDLLAMALAASGVLAGALIAAVLWFLSRAVSRKYRDGMRRPVPRAQ